MKVHLIAILFLLVIRIPLNAQVDYSDKNILLIFWDKDSIETTDYSFKIVTSKDTLSPILTDKYLFSTANINNIVTLLFKVHSYILPIPNIEQYLINGRSLITLRINPNAGDSCVKIIIEPVGGYIGEERTTNKKCSQFHNITFRLFPENEGIDFNEYCYYWLLKKQKKQWWIEPLEGTPAEFEVKQK